MQRFFATLVLFATAGALATEANRPRECPRAELFAAATKLGSPTALPERFARGEHGAIRAISLYESALASDHYRYSALVDAQESQAWVYRYGGYNGSVSWYGPISVSVEQLAPCLPAQELIWLGRNRVLAGVRSSASAPSH